MRESAAHSSAKALGLLNSRGPLPSLPMVCSSSPSADITRTCAASISSTQSRPLSSSSMSVGLPSSSDSDDTIVLTSSIRTSGGPGGASGLHAASDSTVTVKQKRVTTRYWGEFANIPRRLSISSVSSVK
jgi:hypothetical protein